LSNLLLSNPRFWFLVLFSSFLFLLFFFSILL
jgi:hypothetical protein